MIALKCIACGDIVRACARCGVWTCKCCIAPHECAQDPGEHTSKGATEDVSPAVTGDDGRDK